MHPSRCPTREELSAYLLGKLQKERLEAVGDHAITCASCAETLKTLENVQDSLVPLLRLDSGSYPPLDPELLRLLGLAKSLGPRPQPGAAAATPVPSASGRPSAGEGAQLGQYRLLEKIGQGGMGAVYKAMHLRLEKVVP
jgi:anti-sigma factor RsiW